MTNSFIDKSKKYFFAAIIAAFLMQSSGMSLLNVQGAKACEPPTSTITYPVNNTHYKNLLSISGTATKSEGGNDISKVEIKLYDQQKAQYFDGVGYTNTETYLLTNTADNWNNWSYNLNNNYLTSGHSYILFSRATDSAEEPNIETVHSISFYFDNTAPTGSIVINNNADVTNGKDADKFSADCTDLEKPGVNLTFSYSDDSINNSNQLSADDYSSQVHVTRYMKLSNNADMSADSLNTNSGKWITYAADYYATYDLPWYISSENGVKTVYAQFKDETGNESAIYSDQIFYSAYSTTPESTVIAKGNNSYNPVPEVTMDIDANTATNLFVSRYTQNPTDVNPDGITNLGKYFDFSVADDSAINFPVMIKIYFTDAELANAGISNPSDLKGIYYFDFSANSWKLYDNTGVVMTSEKAGYSGYVWANADHFTPMMIGADVTAPNIPANFKAEAKDGSIKLIWDNVDDAHHYDIRYRKSTDNNDSSSYTYIARLTDTNTEITNLENSVEYEFGLRAVDEYDNMSAYAIVVSTAKKAETVTAAATSASTTATANYAYYSYTYTGGQENNLEEEKTTEEVKTDEEEQEIETEGEVKSEDTGDNSEGQTQGARTAVTLGIIIIAIGAALGGYYGYQWWLGSDEESEEDEEPKKEDKPKNNEQDKAKKNKSNRRW